MEEKKKSKKKSIIIALLIIIIICAISAIVAFLVFQNDDEERERKEKSVGTDWGDSYYLYLAEDYGKGSKKDYDGDELDKYKDVSIKFINIDDDSIPEMILKFNAENGEKNKLSIVTIENKKCKNLYSEYFDEDNDLDVCYLYDTEKQDYDWYEVKKENDDIHCNKIIDKIEDNSETAKIETFTQEEFENNFIDIEDVEVAESEFEVGASKSDIFEAVEENVSDFAQDVLTDEIKEEVEEEIENRKEAEKSAKEVEELLEKYYDIAHTYYMAGIENEYGIDFEVVEEGWRQRITNFDEITSKYLTEKAKQKYINNSIIINYSDGNYYILGAGGFAEYDNLRFENIKVEDDKITCDAVIDVYDGYEGNLIESDSRSTFTIVKKDGNWYIDEYTDVS